MFGMCGAEDRPAGEDATSKAPIGSADSGIIKNGKGETYIYNYIIYISVQMKRDCI